MSAIVVCTGLPGTGKTSLSRQVAGELDLVLLSKDAIKEIMFDHMGWQDRAFSGKLAQATFGIMELVVEQMLAAKQSVMVESNYLPALANPVFQDWQRRYHCFIIQLVCQTEPTVLARRFVARQDSPDRHPGHNDRHTYAECLAGCQQRIDGGEDQPLAVNGPVRLIDTTDFNRLDQAAITAWVRQALSPGDASLT